MTIFPIYLVREPLEVLYVTHVEDLQIKTEKWKFVIDKGQLWTSLDIGRKP